MRTRSIKKQVWLNSRENEDTGLIIERDESFQVVRHKNYLEIIIQKKK